MQRECCHGQASGSRQGLQSKLCEGHSFSGAEAESSLEKAAEVLPPEGEKAAASRFSSLEAAPARWLGLRARARREQVERAARSREEAWEAGQVACCGATHGMAQGRKGGSQWSRHSGHREAAGQAHVIPVDFFATKDHDRSMVQCMHTFLFPNDQNTRMEFFVHIKGVFQRIKMT